MRKPSKHKGLNVLNSTLNVDGPNECCFGSSMAVLDSLKKMQKAKHAEQQAE